MSPPNRERVSDTGVPATDSSECCRLPKPAAVKGWCDVRQNSISARKRDERRDKTADVVDGVIDLRNVAREPDTGVTRSPDLAASPFVVDWAPPDN